MTLLKYGSQDTAAVRQLQQLLGIYPDGIFGKLTLEAVKAFQNENDLFPDGIVGDKTWAKLLPGKGFILIRSRRRIDLILVHCTDTPEGKDYSVADIRSWHTAKPPKGNGWSDIAYHYIIHPDGTIENGRDVDIAGAHCEGWNLHSIGVCYIGGRSKDGKPNRDTRTEPQKIALRNLLMDLRKLYPNAEISGHRNYDKKGKTCPNFDARNEYRNI